MQDSISKQRIAAKYQALSGLRDERMSRQGAAAEAAADGGGGGRAVREATGMSPHTIRKGLAELANPGTPIPTRIRRPGGGRSCCTESDPELTTTLELLVDPATRGDPMSPSRRTCQSTTQGAKELTRQGPPVSPSTLGRSLRAAGYSRQSNRKTKAGGGPPDRHAQFEHITATVKASHGSGQPVIAVDTTTTASVGEFPNGGREGQPSGQPEGGLVHDVMDKERGKAIPDGVSDVTGNQGWVSVGIDHDTARCAAEAIRRWWKTRGSKRYRSADRLLITADGGGSHGSRCRLGKVALQDLAVKLGMTLHGCHFPPGTSEWNKSAHRMSCHITQDWRGRPPVSHELISNLISNTATDQGLTIQAGLDRGSYPTGIKGTDERLAAVNMTPDTFHGHGNYSIQPGKRKK